MISYFLFVIIIIYSSVEYERQPNLSVLELIYRNSLESAICTEIIHGIEWNSASEMTWQSVKRVNFR